MESKLQEYKEILENDVELLGYEALRYSIFEGTENNRQEYQIRVEKSNDKFEVYMTADRASVEGKYEFESFFDAMSKFLYLMQLTVLSNRRSVQKGEKPEYPCSLWDKNI
ncbi:Imm59 family immunity protein [Listeria valentina]|uniref:Imm59 family immunity protein n=1 Tax=Listeria valentina TaxID=2705293 RepID=UPI00142F72D3|nr:Imm59 family immunity protein [Listeria valentina]